MRTWGRFLLLSVLLLPVTPANATGCLTGAVAVATGDSHSAVVLDDGSVVAWGSNFSGELGDGTTSTTARLLPAPVPGLTGAVGVAAGDRHTIVAKADGTVWGWGYNSGRLGDGTWVHTRTTPVQAVGLTGAVAVATGDRTSYALTADGSVWAWGDNVDGSIGDGTWNDYAVPTRATIDGVVAFAAGEFHAVALRADGTVWTWGYNYAGQLGVGDTTDRYVPTQVVGLTDVVAVAAGAAHSLALKADGTVWAWGANYGSQAGGVDNPVLGGELSNYRVPVRVPLLLDERFAGVANSSSASFALRPDGTTLSWGADDTGQRGNGAGGEGIVPEDVLGPAFTVLHGFRHVLAIDTTGQVWGWGRNWYGQVGNGTGGISDVTTPVRVGCP
jgi:alpha-tubulin suppressor-like RCC1 family protein